MTKTNKVTVRTAKTQISLSIRPVWSESSLCAKWVTADSESSDQIGRMPSLIQIFAGRTLISLILSCRGSYVSSPIPSNWIKPQIHPFTYHFPNRSPWFQPRKVTEPESQKISVCTENYMHFVALFRPLVTVMTSITLRRPGTQATPHFDHCPLTPFVPERHFCCLYTFDDRPNHCGCHLGKKRPQIHLCKSMAVHFLMNRFVLNGKTWVKLFECQAEVFGWPTQSLKFWQRPIQSCNRPHDLS